MFYGLAFFIVLALVAQFVLSPEHSVRARLLVAGAYSLILSGRYLLPQFEVAVLVVQVAFGIALIFVYRWQHPTDSFL